MARVYNGNAFNAFAILYVYAVHFNITSTMKSVHILFNVISSFFSISP